MSSLLVIVFAVSLIYLGVTERFKSYVLLITLQGVLLFLISFFELDKISIPNLIFIVVETLIFKAIVVPMLLRNILAKTGLTRVHQDALPGIYTIMFITVGLILSIVVAYSLHEKMMRGIFFTTAIFSVFTGMFLIISRKLIFSHLIGFLILENAVFMLSLAVGNEMPMLINIGILLDIFVSILILGIFLMRIGSRLQDMESDSISQLKD